MGACLGSPKDKKPIHLDPYNVTLEHFDKLRVIGKGAFGKVHAVSKRDTKALYAMKCLDKKQIMEKKMLRNVINERKILAQIDYPLIVNLKYSMQTPTDLYMILDLMTGGDVRYHLKHDKRFSEARAKYYTAQTALALNYMHSNGMIHRDVKPDNLLLDKDGNCHLTDFNLSVWVPAEGMKGVAGTRPYMAPEMLRGNYYDIKIDWWSLGVMFYEMIVGHVPFIADDNDTLKRYIMNKEAYIPRDLHKDIKSLLKGMLQKKPEKRFGFKDIKNHPYFADLDWKAVEQKIPLTPWKPKEDRAHVEGIYDLDEHFEAKKKKEPIPPEKDKLFEEWDYNPLKDGLSKGKTPRLSEKKDNDSDNASDSGTTTSSTDGVGELDDYSITTEESDESDEKEGKKKEEDKVLKNGDSGSIQKKKKKPKKAVGAAKGDERRTPSKKTGAKRGTKQKKGAAETNSLENGNGTNG